MSRLARAKETRRFEQPLQTVVVKPEDVQITLDANGGGWVQSDFKSMTDSQKDPRPDLEGDHELWVSVLTNAYQWDMLELYSIMHGLRCAGANLQKTPNSIKLLPGAIEKDNPPGEWDRIKEKYLAPHKETLKQLFEFSRSGTLSDKPIPAEFLLEEKQMEQQRLSFGGSR